MAKAQITLPDGISVSLEGTPDEISATLARLQGAPQRQRSVSSQRSASRGRPQRAQITDLVMNLIDGGFFKKPKDLASVKAALEEMGHVYPITTLSPTMLRQVRKRSLRRLKQDNRWMYTG